jgi:two-component system nitrate/nitrite response regulator NarL
VIRVLIADDHRAVRDGIRTILGLVPDIELVGEAANGLEAMDLARSLQPDVILLDNSMPGRRGVDVALVLTDEMPELGIVLLSLEPPPRDPRLADRPVLYLSKAAAADQLLHAVHVVNAVRQMSATTGTEAETESQPRAE